MEAWQRRYDACQVAIERIGEIHREVECRRRRDHRQRPGRDVQVRQHAVPRRLLGRRGAGTCPRPLETLHESQIPGEWAYHGTEPEAYPVDGKLGLHLIKSLIRDGFDTSQLNSQPEGRSIGHSWTFFRHRVFKDDAVIPMVPVMVNSFFEPNNPTPARSYEIGKAVRRAVDCVRLRRAGHRLRVGRALALRRRRGARLGAARTRCATRTSTRCSALPEEKLVSGSAEIRNWIVGAGFFENEPMELIDYQPCYRTDAMTGCGMAFAEWRA